MYMDINGIAVKLDLRSALSPLASCYFFIKFLADTCPFLGPLVPLFWISGDVSSGFQSQSGFCLIRYFCGGECNVHSPRFTSGATLADLLHCQAVVMPHPKKKASCFIGQIDLNRAFSRMHILVFISRGLINFNYSIISHVVKVYSRV